VSRSGRAAGRVAAPYGPAVNETVRASATRVLLAAAVLCAALGAIGCGSSGDGQTTLRGTYPFFPDSLDPARSITLEGWGAMQNTYLPLLTYAHANGLAGTKLIPALAKGMPRIDDGGRTYTLYLRKGLEYSDGTPVRASDFPFVVERLFRANSPGSPFYTDIVGAERFAATGKGGIPGIEADDRTGRIVIHLKQPRGTFADELGLLYVALLPQGTSDKDVTAHPPPATGPYEIAEVERGRGWRYERNPAWDAANSEAMPDLPGGHFATIRIEVVTNPSTQVSEVENGRSDWMKNPPPPDRIAEIRKKYEGTQFRAEPTISNFYFWMNTQKPPFDDVRVRRAVNYAIDPAALERIYAGTLQATQQILPPGMPGYKKFVLYPHDMAKARELIARADPTDREITVWTINSSPNDEAGEYYEQVLRRLGFRPKLKVIAAGVYFELIGNASTPDLDTGWSNWLLDYPHPNDYFQPQLSGEGIQPSGNTNWARFDDPKLNAKIARLGREELGPRRLEEYSELDREVMEQAPWAPFGNFTTSTFVSSAIDLDGVVVSPLFGQDLTSFRLK
jgi:peptide/nickel transport system substrate-binding protein